MATKKQNGYTRAVKLQEFFVMLANEIKNNYSSTDLVRGDYTFMDCIHNSHFIMPDGLLIDVTITTPELY